MQNDFLAGLNLMVVGMGTVFGFLAILVAAMYGVARLVQTYGEPGVCDSSSAADDESEIAAAIAIARAYSGN